MKTKKFEKLNLSKFDAFKQHELAFLSAMAVEGGYTTLPPQRPGGISGTDPDGSAGAGGTWLKYVSNDGL